MTMGSLLDEDDTVQDTFKALVPSVIDKNVAQSTIMVTPAMQQLYKWAMDEEGSRSAACVLAGPPGLGKTTALYWLYQQLNKQNVFTVLLPFDDLPTSKEKIASQITRDRSERHMVMLLDLTSPSVGDEKRMSIQALVKIIGKHFCKLVIALSSSVRLFTTLRAREATTLNSLLRRSEQLTFQPFDNDTARNFLRSMGITTNVAERLQCCNGIPRLLSLCGIKDYRNAIQGVQEDEFATVSGYMATHHHQVNWKQEINVLMAASLKVPISSVGMSETAAQQTVMCKSHLLRIDNGIPIPYFPTMQDDFLSSQIQTLFSNMNSHETVKTDANSVIGFFFEARLPSLISQHGYRLTLDVKPLTGDSNDKIVTTLKPLYGSATAQLDTLSLPLRSDDTVWRTPSGYKAIDFIVQTEVNLHTLVKATLAVQATVQAQHRPEKIRKSLMGLTTDMVAAATPLIFVLINPLWTDFDENYEAAQEALSRCQTRSRAGRKQVTKFWYGQPSNFNNFKTLHKTLCNTFQS